MSYKDDTIWSVVEQDIPTLCIALKKIQRDVDGQAGRK
jgi:uncharacterized protein with HEPN domain